ncbi:MAG: response regulator [Alphaproteobacteria bacterium]
MVRKILVVDDEADIRAELAEYLETKGYRVEVASDGREAFDRFEAAPADVVLTDIKMPRGDGFELIRRLRAIDPDVPIIVMTGRFSQTDRARAKELGATIMIEKPIMLRRLTQFLKRWFDSDID